MFFINNDNAEQLSKEFNLDIKKQRIFEINKELSLNEQLNKCISFFPIPASFKFAKSILKKLQKENTENDNELKFIYKINVWESFLEEKYSEIAQCPTYNILELAFEEIKDKPIDWNQIGYEKLNISKTDLKMMIKLWGIPKNHDTFHNIYKNIYEKYELHLQKKHQESFF